MPRAFLIKKPNGDDERNLSNEYTQFYSQIGSNGEGNEFSLSHGFTCFNLGVQCSSGRNGLPDLVNQVVHLPEPNFPGRSLHSHSSETPWFNEKPLEFCELYDLFVANELAAEKALKMDQRNYEQYNLGAHKNEQSSVLVRELPWSPINVLFSMESNRTRDEAVVLQHKRSPKQTSFLNDHEKHLPKKDDVTPTAGRKISEENAYKNVHSKKLPLLENHTVKNNAPLNQANEEHKFNPSSQHDVSEMSDQWQNEMQVDEENAPCKTSPDNFNISIDKYFDRGKVQVVESPSTKPRFTRGKANSRPQPPVRDKGSFNCRPEDNTHPKPNQDHLLEKISFRDEYDGATSIGMETTTREHPQEDSFLDDTTRSELECEVLDSLPKKYNRYTCDICGKSFSRSNTLITHKRIHTGDKPFQCGTCSRAFRQPGNLSRHRLTHTTAKPYVCPQCNKAFNRASNLHTHMRTHSNIKPFICEFCGKGFHQKIDMKIHRYTHTGEKPHKCDKCGRGFKQLTHLTYHLRTHSESRMYHCQYCGKGFNQKGNLKAHIYGHTGERPFQCDVCGKGFTLASTLNTHKRTHAPKKPFECHFCGKSFYQRNALKTHYLASHPYTGGQSLL